MFQRFLLTVIVLNYIGLPLSHAICTPIGPILQTLNGYVRGDCNTVAVNYPYFNTVQSDIYTWKSIPFAEPPINQNRFKAPIPVKSWQGILNGTAFPSACLQYSDPYIKESSEDCLYLNIFVKANAYLNRNVTLKPILVFIHGGGLTTGSSSLYDSSSLVAMSDIIVVTINYRLNALGYFHVAGTDSTGNQGVLDQNLALKWIYDNAKYFGGDNNKITISGESAGAWSVSYQLYYQNSWKYFRNAILQSGSATGEKNPFTTITSAEATRRAKIFFDFVGCNSTNSNIQSLECVRNLDSNSILNGYRAMDKYLLNPEYIGNPPFVGAIDGIVFKKSISELTKEGSFKQCNLITGYNKEEGSLSLLYSFNILGNDSSDYLNQAQNFNRESFVSSIRYILKYYPSWPNPANNKFYTNLENVYINSNTNYLNALARLYGDLFFVCPSYNLAESFTRKKNNVYVYNYAYRYITSSIPSNLVSYLGPATHADELAMTLGSALSDDLYFLTSDKDRLFNIELVKYWTNFVTYDNPNGNNNQIGVIWEPLLNPNSDSYKLDSLVNIGKYIYFSNDEIQMKTGYASHNCDFWQLTTKYQTESKPILQCLFDFFSNLFHSWFRH